jgi:hypothetical protein
MAQLHGNKAHLHILIDPNRAKLVFEKAAEADQRPAAWIREAVYSELKRAYPTSIYNEAMAKDQAQWRSSIRNRIEGRANQKDN